jgi:hypothetical protein
VSQGHVEICQLLLDPGAWLIIEAMKDTAHSLRQSEIKEAEEFGVSSDECQVAMTRMNVMGSVASQ